jgi:hypothetical protein
MFMNSEGAAASFTIEVPQLEIQPFDPDAAVPGAPVVELDGVQKSGVIPHCPQISHYQKEMSISLPVPHVIADWVRHTHAFSGHGFKLLISDH